MTFANLQFPPEQRSQSIRQRVLQPVAWVAASVLVLFCSNLQAQTIYRIVGPDGKVTFSDKPPANAAAGKVEPKGSAAGADAGPSALPFALRQAANRYPVTLYTTSDCSPCSSARSMLTRRGIPFNERTVSTQEDMDALKRLTSEGTVPILTVGAQRLRGYSDLEWNQTLSAAGYPETSQLPSGYRNAAATPLVVLEKAPAPKAEEKPAPVAPAAPSEPETPNPAGIKF